MTDLMRLIVLLLIVGAAGTALASGVLWYGDEGRRITRALTKVLKGRPDAILIAYGRGRGIGLYLEGRAVGVSWDRGAWCLVYRLEELIGAELLIDGEVRARAFRGEPRRPLERTSGAVGAVSLRLIFDDPRHPDFELELWEQADDAGDAGASAAASIQEANRWIASVEALLRRSARRAPESPAPPPAEAPPAAQSPQPPPPPAPAPAAAPASRPPPEDREPDFFEDLIDPDEDN